VSPAGDVTHWIEQVKAGNREAVRPLWEAYFRRLVALARKKLREGPRRLADEEDVAACALESFFDRAERGGFPRLEGRDNLWQLLVVITSRKVADLVEHENRLRRGGGRVRGESAFGQPAGDPETGRGIEQVAGTEPTPEFAAEVAEECRRLLGLLDEDTLRQVAQRRLEGYTNEEIAELVGCSRSTVERNLAVIRRVWGEQPRP
jgi:RNA polymerase sigma factor (sigma-70 family)